MTISSAGRSTSSADRPSAAALHDWRGFWRILLAVIAPLPMLAKAVNYLLYPGKGDVPLADGVAAFAAHQQRMEVLQWFDAAFVVLIVPAIVAVAWVSRRGAPRLTTIGAVLGAGGLLSAVAVLRGGDDDALAIAQHGLDVSAISALEDAFEANPIQQLASLGFIIAILIGLPLLGFALWRSKAAPAWMGMALIFGTFTHPFFSVNNVLIAAGLTVAAVGFAGASVALLRMTNDEFDLPPQPAAS